jgi:CheY-like chemotaxis protein/HPt (histidine-containing phosphotransfer) domain-containing protein
MSRELLTVLLEGEGYTVQSADSGDSALALLSHNSQPPDVILSDINMPGTAGAPLARKFRAACGPATLLLAMSGTRQPKSALTPFNGFLLKPFTMHEIAAALSAPRQQISTAAQTSIHSSTPPTASNPPMESSVQNQLPPDSASFAAPVLNETIYEKLAGSMPLTQLQELYLLCVNDARKRIDFMRSLVTNHDTDRFVREAHALKGSCGMLGASQLHGMAAELETRGLDTAGDHQAQEVNSLDELSAACDRLERMLGSRV